MACLKSSANKPSDSERLISMEIGCKKSIETRFEKTSRNGV